MKTLIPTNWKELRNSLGQWSDSFGYTIQQILEKGKEIQSATEKLLFTTPVREFPQIDLTEGSEEFYMIAELPGLTLDDFQVEIVCGTVIIKGEKKVALKSGAAAIHLAECKYGIFERQIPLPGKVVEEKACGEFKNGVLVLRIPKAEISQLKRVQVKIT